MSKTLLSFSLVFRMYVKTIMWVYALLQAQVHHSCILLCPPALNAAPNNQPEGLTNVNNLLVWRQDGGCICGSINTPHAANFYDEAAVNKIIDQHLCSKLRSVAKARSFIAQPNAQLIMNAAHHLVCQSHASLCRCIICHSAVHRCLCK